MELLEKESPDHMIVGEIVRLIDCITDPVKVGIIYKYAEVSFNMKSVDELARKLNSKDKDSSYEEFKKMTKQFVERL